MAGFSGRLSADDYFRVALDVLGESGSRAMTIAVLCERLQVTKGSFYHHFGGLQGFVDGLLAYWESEHSERLIAVSKAQPDVALRFYNLSMLGAALPHASEAAMRAWGRSDAEVAEAVARVDKRRERHVVESIVALGVERARARLFTRIALNILVGAQMREDPVDAKRLRQAFEEVNRVVLAEADPRLVARLEGHVAR